MAEKVRWLEDYPDKYFTCQFAKGYYFAVQLRKDESGWTVIRYTKAGTPTRLAIYPTLRRAKRAAEMEFAKLEAVKL